MRPSAMFAIAGRTSSIVRTWSVRSSTKSTSEPIVTALSGRVPGIVQLGALDFLEQHRRNDRLAMLGLERQGRDHVGFGGEQVNGRARTARADE